MIKTLDIEKQYRTLKEFEKYYNYITKEKPIFIPKNEIEQFIRDLNKFESELQDLNKRITKFSISDEELDKMRVEIEDLLSDILNIMDPKEATKLKEKLKSVLDQESLENFLKGLSKEVLVLTKMLYTHLSLFYLAIITFPHAVVARYPEDNINPLEIYNESHPLIQLFDECAKILNKTLAKIEEVRKARIFQ